MTLHPSTHARRCLVQAARATCLGVGALALIGWIFHIPAMTRVELLPTMEGEFERVKAVLQAPVDVMRMSPGFGSTRDPYVTLPL